MPKTCHVAVSKPNRKSLCSLRGYHGKAGGTPSKPAAEGFDVLRPSKAAAKVLRVLRGAQNVPRSSFEAQYRKSLWGLGRYHGKAGGTHSKPAAEGFDVLYKAFESCCEGFEGFKGCPKRAT